MAGEGCRESGGLSSKMCVSTVQLGVIEDGFGNGLAEKYRLAPRCECVPNCKWLPQKGRRSPRGSTNEAFVVAYWHVPGLTVP